MEKASEFMRKGLEFVKKHKIGLLVVSVLILIIIGTECYKHSKRSEVKISVTDNGEIEITNTKDRDLRDVEVIIKNKSGQSRIYSEEELKSGKSFKIDTDIEYVEGINVKLPKHYAILSIVLILVFYFLVLPKKKKRYIVLGTVVLLIMIFNLGRYNQGHLDDYIINYLSKSIKVGNERLEVIVLYSNLDSRIAFIDSNGNGYPDCVEYMDIVRDTDGDGIPDYFEVCFTNTSPVLVDTFGNGLGDALNDTDGDGVNNIEELKLGSNPYLEDSDNDGLTDKEEFELGTDVNYEDTDEDGLDDKTEVDNGYDPLTYNEEFKITKNWKDKVFLEIVASGEVISGTRLDASDDVLLELELGNLPYESIDLDIPGEFTSAKLMFDISNINKNDLENLGIYYYNEETQEIEEQKSYLEGDKFVIELEHSSIYMLLNKLRLGKLAKSIVKYEDIINKGKDIAIVLDISYSLNDIEFNLFDSLSNLIDGLTLNDNNRIGLVTFTKSVNTLNNLTDNTRELSNNIKNIEIDSGFNEDSGTDISNAVYTTIDDMLSGSKNRGYMLLVSDGCTFDNDHKREEVIDFAKKNNITVYTICMRAVGRTYMLDIANQTGGKCYELYNPKKMEERLNELHIELFDREMDSNSDGLSDYVTKLICDDKLVTKLGYNVFRQHKFEDVQSSKDIDNDNILNGKEFTIINDNDMAYVKLLSSPIITDTDKDGIPDNSDNTPLKVGIDGGIVGELILAVNNKADKTFFKAGESGGLIYQLYGVTSNAVFSALGESMKSSIGDDLAEISGNSYVFDIGHSWITFKSYISTEIDNSTYITKYNPVHRNSIINKHIIDVGSYTTFGLYPHEKGDNTYSVDGGIFLNRELSNYEAYKGYTYSIHCKISADELDDFIQFSNKYNHKYNGYTNNCTTFSVKAWNKVTHDNIVANYRKKLIYRLSTEINRLGASWIRYYLNEIYGYVYTPFILKFEILKRANCYYNLIEDIENYINVNNIEVIKIDAK